MKFKITINEAAGQSDVLLFNRLLTTVEMLYNSRKEFVSTGGSDIIIKNRRGKLFDKKSRTKLTGTPHECYQNSLKNNINDPELKVAAGICFSTKILELGLEELDADLSKDFESIPGFMIFCFDHCWNIDKNNKVVDSTINSKKYIYFGEIIDLEKYNINDPSDFSQYSKIQKYIISTYFKR